MEAWEAAGRAHQAPGRTSSPSMSSASTSATRTPTRASTRRSITAGFAHGVKVNIHWVEAEALEEPGGEQLLDGARRHPGARRVRQPRHARHDAGGGSRARQRGIPYFGICYGFQWATVEYARNVCGLARGRLDRVQPGHAAQGDLQAARPARRRRPGRHDAARCSTSASCAGVAGAADLRRDRDPRAAPPSLRVQLPVRAGARPTRACVISGRSPDGKFVEIVELPGHPWYVAVQFHPEFKSKPLTPHPLFASFVEASYRTSSWARRQAKRPASARDPMRRARGARPPAAAPVHRAHGPSGMIAPCQL